MSQAGKGFAGRLAAAMEEAGVEDAEVAKSLGVSRSTIRRWRTGVSEPHAGTMRTAMRTIRRCKAK